MPQTHLYMLAIMPPDELMMLIDGKRKSFSINYGFKAALKPPVHATIYEPFHATEDIEKRFATLRGIIKNQVPFSVELNNYSFFDNPSMKHPVVYIAVKENVVLRVLQKKILKEVDKIRKGNSKLTSYTPYFTIGYKDVTWESFSKIKVEYSEKGFDGSFSCDTIFLWKHDGKNWQIHDEFRFEGKDGDNMTDGQLELF